MAVTSQKDLLHETSTTTGTGNFTTAAVNGKVQFGDASNGFGTGGTNVFDYFISNRDAAEWERGTGHCSALGTLVRDTVIRSTNANAAVNFSAGTKDITNDVPALNQLRSGNNLSELLSFITSRINLGAFGTVSIQVKTATGTYTPPSNFLFGIGFAIGGGAGAGGVVGGGANFLAASFAGGAGSLSIGIHTAADIGASKAVTIGAKGTGGTGAANGGAGGDTSLGSLLIGKGAGSSSYNNAGTFGGATDRGGVAGTGTITGNGACGAPPPFNAASTFNAIVTAGKGGDSLLGGGGAGLTTVSAASAGNNATGFGAGGGAAAAGNTSSSAKGGDGTDGIFFMIEFCN